MANVIGHVLTSNMGESGCFRAISTLVSDDVDPYPLQAYSYNCITYHYPDLHQ